VLDGEARKSMAAAQLQLRGDVRAVVIDGAGADAQDGGDLLDGLELCNVPQDFPLGCRETVDPRRPAGERLGALGGAQAGVSTRPD
jgi:hypothetical protein